MASGVSSAMRSRADARHALAGRQAERHHFFRGGRIEPAVEPLRAHLHAAPRHVLGERGQPRQRLLDAVDARRDEGAGAVPLHQYAAAHQILHGLAHRDARHVGLDRDVAFGGQRIAGSDDAGVDRLLDALLQLQIERRALLRRVAHGLEDVFGRVSHRRARACRKGARPWRRRRRAHRCAAASASPEAAATAVRRRAAPARRAGRAARFRRGSAPRARLPPQRPRGRGSPSRPDRPWPRARRPLARNRRSRRAAR